MTFETRIVSAMPTRRCPHIFRVFRRSKRGDTLMSNTTRRSINRKHIQSIHLGSLLSHVQAFSLPFSLWEQYHSTLENWIKCIFHFHFYVCVRPLEGTKYRFDFKLQRINCRHKKSMSICCRGFSTWFVRIKEIDRYVNGECDWMVSLELSHEVFSVWAKRERWKGSEKKVPRFSC